MKAKCYVSDTGKSGFAIKPNGDIISVFAARDSGEGYATTRNAIKNGGIKLDCFDGKLPEFYGKFHFKEYDRWKWNDQYAPSGWNYEKFDQPDVVLMEL